MQNQTHTTHAPMTREDMDIRTRVYGDARGFRFLMTCSDAVNEARLFNIYRQLAECHTPMTDRLD